ncbi:apoptosis-resistant E3 ubiquitin protein ligase 1-like isoform X1 [Vespula squamosa]|uniref:Apoptosis-resistant E3 ubiquitin protein ligase 1-like isoform X1 n=1 Tax=Vespula squamosa TaxID=30214 RepID=A0ABD2BN17_VESSQ
MARWSTVLSGVFLALSMILSLGKLLMLAAGNGSNGDLTEADQWLAEIGFKQYRPLFRKKVQIEKEQISEVVASEVELFAFVTDILTSNT